MQRKVFLKVPQMVGGLAIALGVFLALAVICVREDGSTIIKIPNAGSVGALALIFILSGVAVCQQVRLARWPLGLAFVCLALCQTGAASQALQWTAALQHGLFALWLWGGALVLGLQGRPR